MRAKAALLPLLSVMVTTLVGCDNVAWGGVDFELRPPDPPPSALLPPDDPDGEPPPPEPVLTPPLLYLVEREGAEATLLPVAAVEPDGSFSALPGADETPELVERFPLERWEAGTEFLLVDRGRRAGTLIADGSSVPHTETCLLRPAGRGAVELRPEAQGVERFLALRKADLGRPGLEGIGSRAALPGSSWPAYPGPANLREHAQAVARYTLQRSGIPWPPSIPEFTRDQRALTFPDGTMGVVGAYAFGGELATGRIPVSGFGLLVVARPSETGGWVPVWLWHQEVRQGKAFPRALAEGGLLDPGGGTELLLEVFGEEDRWFALAGERDGAWQLLYQDPCGVPAAGGAARPWSG
jgi:hypothetical protein